MKVQSKQRAETGKPIKAHSSAIQITHKLSLVQHKAWLILLRNAYYEINNSEIKKHKLRLSELATYLGYTSNRNDKYLKKLLEGLVETKVSWNILDKEGDGEWGAASLLAGCKVKKGVVEYDYSAFLREKLYNPKMFALLNLKILNQFRSKYALALYNLCKDYIGVGKTPYIELEKFREFVGLEPHEYTDFKSLNRRVIKEPVEEINRISDIIVEVTYTRERRKVAGLRFLIKSNPQLTFDIESIADQVINAPLPQKTDNVDVTDPLYNHLLSFGVKPKQAQKVMESHDRDYIEQNLEMVEKACRTGNINNVTAYTISALKEDFRPSVTFLEEERRAKEIKDKKEKEESIRIVDFKRLWEDFEIHRLEESIESLPEEEKEKLEDQFLKSGEGSLDFIRQYYRQNGFDSIVVKGAFLSFVKEKLLDSAFDPADFEKFISKKGINPSLFKEEIDSLKIVAKRLAPKG